MVVAEMTHCGKEADERVYIPRLHRWFPGCADEHPVRRKILPPHLVLPKIPQKVSRKREKDPSCGCQRKRLRRATAAESKDLGCGMEGTGH
jgi:hypothetical protein